MRLRFERIGEEDDEIDFSVHDARADLLVAAERSAVEAADRKSGLFRDHFCGGSGSAEEVMLENGLVGETPIDDFRLFVVVCDERDVFLPRQRAFDVFVFKHKISFLLRRGSGRKRFRCYLV